MFAAIQLAPRADPQLVLLVDGHDDTRELYASYLTSVGYDVEDSATITDAMRLIARHPPDVIVTELKLPGGDGLQFCRTLKESSVTHDVPLIAVTAAADAPTARGACAAGCAAVLVKPCLPAELRLEIVRVLEASRAARRSSAVLLRRAQALTAKASRLKERTERLLEDATERLRRLTRRRFDD